MSEIKTVRISGGPHDGDRYQAPDWHLKAGTISGYRGTGVYQLTEQGDDWVLVYQSDGLGENHAPWSSKT